MAFAGVNYLAVLVAAVASFAFGALWYGLLGKQWMAALGMTEPPKAGPWVYVITFFAQLVIAWTLAGVVGHLGEAALPRALIVAGLLWFGLVLTTMTVNHRFQSQPWSLTLIDGGHWLGGLMIMGLVIGLFGL